MRQSTLLLFILLLMQEVIAMEPPKTLADLSWQYRLIVVVDPEDVLGTVRQLQANTKSIAERDILWFVMSESRTISNLPTAVTTSMTASLRAMAQDLTSTVLLIGKDGGVKSSTDVLKLTDLFALIDRMPMRRQEMQRQQGD